MHPYGCSSSVARFCPHHAIAGSCGAILAAALLLCDPAGADWPAEGVALCSACIARNPVIAPDGTGGAFVAWIDERNSPTGSNDDIFLQRVTASGAIAPGWPADGFPVCLAPATQLSEWVHSIVPDGSGGVILAWRDHRNGYADVYAQRVLAGGSIAPGWPLNGAAVAQGPGTQDHPSVAPDGAGGAFFTWDDQETWDIHAQHLTGTGDIAPGWAPNGLPICTLPSVQGGPQALPDGEGGVFIVWGDLRDGPVSQYAQRVTASGQLHPGWPENGIRIVASRYLRDLATDGAGGLYVACATIGPLYDDDYYLQRFTGSGALVAGWPEGGASVCQAPDERSLLRAEPDGAGGVLLTWGDHRDIYDDDVFAVRMRPDGTRDPRWPADGLRVTDDADADDSVDLAPDGLGGAYLCWLHGLSEPRVTIQHLTGAGTVAPGWPAGGHAVPTVDYSAQPLIAPDGMGGAIVTWGDDFSKIRALRIAPDGPVAVAVSLVSAEATSDRVVLRWQAPGLGSMVANVYRREVTTDWTRLGAAVADGADALRYEDRAVTAGARYDYRLGYMEDGGEQFSREARVDVPLPARFALVGLTPNPSVGDPVAVFSLAGAEPAMLEVFDLHGRLVFNREVGGLGAGVHRIPIGERGRLPAGIYAVRLRQGRFTATARAAVVR